MTTSQQTIVPLDQTRPAGPNGRAEVVEIAQVAVPSASDDPTTGRHGSKEGTTEIILRPQHASRPCYPAWPTSQPGPRATVPLAGQKLHPTRTDQVIYECYDQEQGMPCVLPPGPPLRKNKARTYLPDANFQKAVSEKEALERWLDDGGASAYDVASDVEGFSSF